MPTEPTHEQKAFADILLALFRQGYPLTRLHRELADRIMEYDEVNADRIRMLKRQLQRAKDTHEPAGVR